MLTDLGWFYGGLACERPSMLANGAAAQQASAEYFRKQQEGAFNALAPTAEQQAEWKRYYATKRHVDALKTEHGLDWHFWCWLCAMAALMAGLAGW